MTVYVLIAALVCVGALYAWSQERARNANAVLTQRHMEHIQALSEAHAKAVADLCQRIQAPEAAVMQHQMETFGDNDPLLPLTDKQSAEAEERGHIIRMIEEMEASKS